MGEGDLKAELFLQILKDSKGDIDAALHEYAEYFISCIILLSKVDAGDDKDYDNKVIFNNISFMCDYLKELYKANSDKLVQVAGNFNKYLDKELITKKELK